MLGMFLLPALGVTGFKPWGQHEHRLLLLPITTVPALTLLLLRAMSLQPFSPIPGPGW